MNMKRQNETLMLFEYVSYNLLYFICTFRLRDFIHSIPHLSKKLSTIVPYSYEATIAMLAKEGGAIFLFIYKIILVAGER